MTWTSRPETPAPWKLPYGLLTGGTSAWIVPKIEDARLLTGGAKFGWLRMLSCSIRRRCSQLVKSPARSHSGLRHFG